MKDEDKPLIGDVIVTGALLDFLWSDWCRMAAGYGPRSAGPALWVRSARTHRHKLMEHWASIVGPSAVVSDTKSWIAEVSQLLHDYRDQLAHAVAFPEFNEELGRLVSNLTSVSTDRKLNFLDDLPDITERMNKACLPYTRLAPLGRLILAQAHPPNPKEWPCLGSTCVVREFNL